MNEYLTLLRHNRDFRYLWLGSVISQLGDWFNVIAAAELITRLTDSGLALSGLFVARFLGYTAREMFKVAESDREDVQVKFS